MAASLQSMRDYWKNFDLSELQKELDCSATELAARQDQSDASRKRLVEQSREFKKNTPEDVRKVVAPLLKCFQTEIDSLSKRSKNAEAAFLSIYKKLIDLPDPVPWLEAAILYQKKSQRAEDVEIENQKLRETLDEYNNEFAEVKNQEVTIKQLREKLKESEERTEVSAQLRAKDKEKELQRQFTDKERQLQETQLTVAKQLGEAEHRVATLQSALDTVQAESFELRTKYEEVSSAKADEMEMIMSDLERANERASAAERQVEQLRRQLAAAEEGQSGSDVTRKSPADMEQAIDILKRSSLEVELAAKEKEISQLVEDVQKLQASLNKLRETSAVQIAKLEEELSLKSRALQKLEERMRTQADYDELKRELNIMKSIEFASPSEQEGTDEARQRKSLEVLLLEKNKALQTENTQLKVASSDLSGDHSDSSLDDEHSRQSPESVDRVGSKLSSTLDHESKLNDNENNLPKDIIKTESKTESNMDESEVKLELSDNNKQAIFSKMAEQSRASSSTSSTPTTPGGHLPHHPNAEMFATMLGQDLMANFHLQSQMFNGQFMHRLPIPVTLPNGFPAHPELLKRLQPNSPPMGQLVNGHVPPSNPHESAKLHRLPSDIKSEASASTVVLDTAEVALRVRETLSANNIGQRLFAKHVLGLSQGTVSELLSKPKHWDKLTEKGRESYRKMNAWANSQHHVESLKAISPKKGSQPIVATNKQESAQTEERIAAILNEAQAAMAVRQNQERTQIANAMVASIYQHELAKLTGLPMPSQKPSLPGDNGDDKNRLSRLPIPENAGNLTQEIVAKIYREELLKLALAAEKCGNFAESTMYRQELARLAARAQQQLELQKKNTLTPKSEENKENLMENNNSQGKIKEEVTRPDSPEQSDGPQDLRINTGSQSGSSDDNAQSRHTGSAFSLVRPRSNGGCDSENSPPNALPSSTTPNPANPAGTNPLLATTSGAAPKSLNPEDLSPLQQMQSIANSLMAKNSAAGHQQRPLKAVLPPISQDVFDKFANINTDELVKHVKETLSQYSISQRLFGESVLGLSQGSVSDLLARPKPWHMLTQKGREPFIRMQIFLEDQEAIPRLVANQYKIAPEKLLRTNSMGDSLQQVPATEKPTTSNSIVNQVVNQVANQILPASRAQSSSPAPLPSPPRSAAHTAPAPQFSPFPSMPTLPAQFPLPHPFPIDPSMYSAALQPNVFELAAMTQELDTLLITSKVKEILQFHNLGQKLFGEAILGLSQGSVSELLSKPKPWHMLSLKGREPFIKMHLWLNDPHNIDRLRFYQNELKANRKRRCSTEDRGEAGLNSSVGSNGGHSSKKARVFFSEEQKDLLRLSYNKDPYPSQARIEDLANTLGVGTKTIVNWFHNHRMRAKQVQGLGSPSMVPPMNPLNPFTAGSTASSSRSENWEGENSNTSEVSSSPSDSGQGQKSGITGPGSPPDIPGAQWMFPRFEPLSLATRKISSASCEESAQDLSRHENNDVTNSENEAEDLSVPKSSAQTSRDENTGEDNESQSLLSEGVSGLAGMSDVNGGRSVSRRKNSRPQWVFEGTQLEKSRSGNTVSPGQEKNQESENNESNTLSVVKQMKNNNCGETSDGDSNANESASSDQEDVSNGQRKRKMGKVESPFLNTEKANQLDSRLATENRGWEDSN